MGINQLMNPFSKFTTVGQLSILMTLVSFFAIVSTLGAPGITIDEPLDVRPGRTYVETLTRSGWKFFDRAVVNQTFADNAEHPPLGRWLLGIASKGGEFLAPWLGGNDPYNVHPARLAPAIAFGLLVGLVTLSCGQRYGRAGGLAAGFSVMVMPRMFAHAHLAALDTFLCLFWTLAILSVEWALRSHRPVMTTSFAGLALGLALLTKIHAWFLVPIVGVWTLGRRWMDDPNCPRAGGRGAFARSIFIMIAWASVGFATYLIGWPWLWYDTLPRLSRYLGTGVDRLSLRVLYFGQVYADRDVPWHYPWFYFAVSVPIGLQVFGLFGVRRAWRERKSDPFLILLIGAILTFLLVFSTRIPVYDGERLILLTFPLWAIVIGAGFQSIWEYQPSVVGPQLIKGFLALSLVLQSYGLVTTYPFGLSYFNLLVGGLRGADQLGLEVTYWGDAVDVVLLDRLAQEVQPGETVALVPTLHHIQPVATLTPALVAKNVRLLDQSAFESANWLIVSRREAYWPPNLKARLSTMRPVAIRSRDGVWLSGLFHDETRKVSSRQPSRSL